MEFIIIKNAEFQGRHYAIALITKAPDEKEWGLNKGYTNTRNKAHTREIEKAYREEMKHFGYKEVKH